MHEHPMVPHGLCPPMVCVPTDHFTIDHFTNILKSCEDARHVTEHKALSKSSC